MPLTTEKFETGLHNPALAELLPVRDYLDNVAIRTNGCFVAGYELRGQTSYFAGDEARAREKTMLEALLRALPEQSMRMQIRYETTEDLGALIEDYVREIRSDHNEAEALESFRIERWKEKETAGAYTRPLLHAYFIWTRSFIIASPERCRAKTAQRSGSQAVNASSGHVMNIRHCLRNSKVCCMKSKPP